MPAPHLRNSCIESGKRLHWQPASVETHHVVTFDFIHTCLYDRCQMKVTGSARGGRNKLGLSALPLRRPVGASREVSGRTVHAERRQQIHITQLCDCEQPWASARPLCACTQRITGARRNHKRVGAEVFTGSFAAVMGGWGAQGGGWIEQGCPDGPPTRRRCPACSHNLPRWLHKHTAPARGRGGQKWQTAPEFSEFAYG